MLSNPNIILASFNNILVLSLVWISQAKTSLVYFNISLGLLEKINSILQFSFSHISVYTSI